MAATPASCDPAEAMAARTELFRELRRLGASAEIAGRTADSARRWWLNSSIRPSAPVLVACFHPLGGLGFSCPQLLEPPGTDPHAGWYETGGRYDSGIPDRPVLLPSVTCSKEPPSACSATYHR